MGASLGPPCACRCNMVFSDESVVGQTIFAKRLMRQSVESKEVEEEYGLDGQEHVKLMDMSNEEKATLDEHMGSIDVEWLEHAYNRSLDRLGFLDNKNIKPPHELIWQGKRLPKMRQGSNFTLINHVRPKTQAIWRSIGYQHLVHNEIAVVILAGGEEPQFRNAQSVGVVDVGLISKKSLFQVYCERIKRLENLCHRSTEGEATEKRIQKARERVDKIAADGGTSGKSTPRYPEGPSIVIPVYVMLNEHNEMIVKDFFRQNNFFGLRESSVIFFVQDYIPLLNRHGKILLEDRGLIWRVPGGSGSLFDALIVDGAYADMKARGISAIYAMNCNNMLTRVADPAFIGYCFELHTHAGIKVVERLTPSEDFPAYVNREKVIYKDVDGDGDLDVVNSNISMVVHKAEISDSSWRLRDRKQRMLFNSGDAGQYFFRIDMVPKLAAFLKHHTRHVQYRGVPYMSIKGGKKIFPEPNEQNALLLKSCITDTFEHFQSTAALLVDRLQEYAVIRSREDIPAACSALGQVHQAWLAAAGAKFHNTSTPGLTLDSRCEVSPLVSYDGEDLQGLFPKTRFAEDHIINLPFHLMACKEEVQDPMPVPEDRNRQRAQLQVMYVRTFLACEEAQSPVQEDLRFYPEAGLTEDGDALQLCADSERLAVTPRWLKDEVDKWKEEQDRKLLEFEMSKANEEEMVKKKREEEQAKKPKHVPRDKHARRNAMGGAKDENGSPSTSPRSPR